MSLDRYSRTLPPPSPSDDLRPPPPTAVVESQWVEPRSDAFGTGARVAGSISLWPILLPICRVGEEEGGVGREWSVLRRVLAMERRSICTLSVVVEAVLFPSPFNESPLIAVHISAGSGKTVFWFVITSWSRRGVSRVRMPLAPARVAGSISLWPVLLAIVHNVKPILAPLWQDDRRVQTLVLSLSRCLTRSLFDPLTPMTFIIVWNGLYNANKEERNAVEERVQAHFVRRKLWRRMVKFAFMRPTGWHGESGAAESGGYITVDFCTRAVLRYNASCVKMG
ncbi:hypothetical protein EDB83DRAFT_2320511 [Lactarius deliciosus]|nr:hypothetical protein EDB83DRAFT_2320511 [Lactarius deliciosus]